MEVRNGLFDEKAHNDKRKQFLQRAAEAKRRMDASHNKIGLANKPNFELMEDSKYHQPCCNLHLLNYRDRARKR